MAELPPMVKQTLTDVSDIILHIARLLVDSPEALKLEVVLDKRNPALILSAADEDVGKLVGRNARMAGALRTLLDALSARKKLRITLQIRPSSMPSQDVSTDVINHHSVTKKPATPLV